MSSEKDELITVRVSPSLKEDAKRNAEHGEISKRCREALREIAYGEAAIRKKKHQLEHRLQRTRSRIDERRSDRRRVQAEIESLEAKATRIEERLASFEEKSDKKETILESLEHQLRQGIRITAKHVPEEFDAAEIISALKDRNPDTPPLAFRLAKPGEELLWSKEVDRQSNRIEIKGSGSGGDRWER